jgi:hypothetical protein
MGNARDIDRAGLSSNSDGATGVGGRPAWLKVKWRWRHTCDASATGFEAEQANSSQPALIGSRSIQAGRPRVLVG